MKGVKLTSPPPEKTTLKKPSLIRVKMIHDENNVLTDDELIIARDSLKLSNHACLYMQNEHPKEFKPFSLKKDVQNTKTGFQRSYKTRTLQKITQNLCEKFKRIYTKRNSAFYLFFYT